MTEPKHSGQPRRSSLPRVPWFKDERVGRLFGNLTAARAIRIFIGAVLVFIVMAAIVIWQLVDNNAQTNGLAHANKTQADTIQAQANQIAAVVAQLKQSQIDGRKTRDQLQRRTDDSIAALWCTLVSQAPNDPKRPIIAQVRKKYHCPPFNPKDVGHLPSSSPSGTAGLSNPNQPTENPAPGPGRSGQPAPAPTPTPGPTRTVPVPVPVPGPTTTVPAPPKPTPPILICLPLLPCLTLPP